MRSLVNFLVLLIFLLLHYFFDCLQNFILIILNHFKNYIVDLVRETMVNIKNNELHAISIKFRRYFFLI